MPEDVVAVGAVVVEEAGEVEAEEVCDIQVRDHQADPARVLLHAHVHKADRPHAHVHKKDRPHAHRQPVLHDPAHDARVNHPGVPVAAIGLVVAIGLEQASPVVAIDLVVADLVRETGPVGVIDPVVVIDPEQASPVVADLVGELAPAEDHQVAITVEGSIMVVNITDVIIVVTTTVDTTGTGETPAATGTDTERSII